ncbi:DUF4328 domain-containing protein [Actinophytocola sp.]|uniref:DUF4328 domain-containing protein n=1 Tax=Actinophytocola sp. TaxID=1872138 RepID=UPI002D802104|nr:DUF4328 domain-containing protein [Actinophytocola sp.]HET9138030.1 DUF4328 domain-containing protein [Actinophytocola sp.]
MEQYPQWVATPPPGSAPATPPRRRPGRYQGPPSYSSPPRWGFPALAWRWPTSVPGTPTRAPATVDQVRSLARQAVPMLWVVAVTALIAAAAEIWRYVLLVQSRTAALSRATVEFSDGLVGTGAVLCIAFALVAACLTVWWLLAARSAAADLAGVGPARPSWQVLVGLVIPGVNLVVPGSALAELEHTVLRRPVEQRPRPSRLVLAWWVAWWVSGLLCTAALLWRLRTGVQAQADGVLLHALTYLAAAVVAVLSVWVVRGLTTLLVPIDPASVRLLRVLKVEGAPDPPLRARRPPGAAR